MPQNRDAGAAPRSSGTSFLRRFSMTTIRNGARPCAAEKKRPTTDASFVRQPGRNDIPHASPHRRSSLPNNRKEPRHRTGTACSGTDSPASAPESSPIPSASAACGPLRHESPPPNFRKRIYSGIPPCAGDRKNIEVRYGGRGRFGEGTVGTPINFHIA